MIRELHQLSTETLHSNPYFELRQDAYTLPDGSTGTYYYVHTSGSVIVVPRMADGRIVLVQQYRYLNRRPSLEFPGGGIRPGTSPEQAARAELQEEAGLSPLHLKPLGTINPCKGLTDELCTVFLAEGLADVPSSPDHSEEFELLSLTAGEVDDAIRRGDIWDGMTLSAWMLCCLTPPTEVRP